MENEHLRFSTEMSRSGTEGVISPAFYRPEWHISVPEYFEKSRDDNVPLGPIKHVEGEHLRFPTEISWPKWRVSFSATSIGPNVAFPCV